MCNRNITHKNSNVTLLRTLIEPGIIPLLLNINLFNIYVTFGVSDEVLKNLFEMYDRKFELIEESNYKTLIDTYSKH